jgi:hypothetical protein
MAMTFNCGFVTKVPALMKPILANIKSDLNELKDAILELKNSVGKIKTDGLACAENNLTTPVDCYKQIFGPIKYT